MEKLDGIEHGLASCDANKEGAKVGWGLLDGLNVMFADTGDLTRDLDDRKYRSRIHDECGYENQMSTSMSWMWGRI